MAVELKVEQVQEEKTPMQMLLDATDGPVEAETEVEVKEEEKEVEKVETEVKSEAEVKSEVDPKDEEIAELRRITREQKRALDDLTVKIENTNKVIEDANLISPEDKEKQVELQQAYAARNNNLNSLLTIMEVNPRYEDVKEVVSQTHFDEMVEAMTNAVVEKQGGDPKEIYRKLESDIWVMDNPYKYMYELIKTYHPAYRKAEEVKDEGKKDEGTKDGTSKSDAKNDKKKDELVKVPGSLQDVVTGSGVDSSVWTAAKIDVLPEDELVKVPRDIYEKYMRNELK